MLKNISSMNPIAADVVIIGGGIAGLSTAYWLQKEDPNLKISLLEKEIEMIKLALKRSNGKRKAAAEELGISERTLYRKIKQFDLQDNEDE